MVSHAFSKSKKMANTESWRAKAVVMYDSRNARGSAVLRAQQKPYCEGGSRLLNSRNHMSLELTIRSSSLQIQLVRAIGGGNRVGWISERGG